MWVMIIAVYSIFPLMAKLHEKSAAIRTEGFDRLGNPGALVCVCPSAEVAVRGEGSDFIQRSGTHLWANALYSP